MRAGRNLPAERRILIRAASQEQLDHDSKLDSCAEGACRSPLDIGEVVSEPLPLASHVNRNFLVSTLALGAVALLGALYSKLTEAAPADPVPSAAPSPPLVVAPALPAPAKSADPAPDPETERLEARRQLYESVDALVQASEFEKARKLLDEDQDRYGDDLAPQWRDLEQSYRLIADCLEHPTPKLRLRAEAFMRVSEALSLKPRITAACSKPH
jgi:hypothetical protein